MAVKALIDNLEDVDEGLREHYKKRDDGKYVIEGDFKTIGLEDIGPLSKANKRLKAERSDLREELEPLKQYRSLLDVEGFDPSEVSTLMAASEAGGDSVEAIEKLERQHAKALGALQEENKTLRAEGVAAVEEKDTFIKRTTLLSAAAKSKILDESLDDVVKLNIDNVVIEGEDVFMKDADGDSTGVTPLEYFQGAHKENKGHLYEVEGSGGSGVTSKGSKTTSAASSYADAKTPAEKAAAIKAQREADGLET